MHGIEKTHIIGKVDCSIFGKPVHFSSLENQIKLWLALEIATKYNLLGKYSNNTVLSRQVSAQAWYSSGANHYDAAEQHNCFLAIWLGAWVTSPSP